MRAWSVAVGLFIGTDLKLGGMRDQRIVGQLELDVLATAAPLRPVM